MVPRVNRRGLYCPFPVAFWSTTESKTRKRNKFTRGKRRAGACCGQQVLLRTAGAAALGGNGGIPVELGMHCEPVAYSPFTEEELRLVRFRFNLVS